MRNSRPAREVSIVKESVCMCRKKQGPLTRKRNLFKVNRGTSSPYTGKMQNMQNIITPKCGPSSWKDYEGTPNPCVLDQSRQQAFTPTDVNCKSDSH